MRLTPERLAEIAAECRWLYGVNDLLAHIAAVEAELVECRRCLEVSEDFRRAYMAGKYALYSSGAFFAGNWPPGAGKWDCGSCCPYRMCSAMGGASSTPHTSAS